MKEIKTFETIDEHIRLWIQEIVSEDKLGLSPKTLFNNIYNSDGDERQLAQLFEVPVGLIRAIKK